MFDCDDYLSSGSDESFPPSPIYDRPSVPIIEDWVSDSENESETKISQNVPSFVQPTEQVKSPRPSVQHVETYIPTSTPKTAILKPTYNGKCKNKKACFVCKSLETVTRPRQAKIVVTKSNSPPRRHINRSLSSKASTFPLKVTVVKALMVNAAQFCGMKGIKREFSVPRTPQQNHIAERKNRTLIEAAKTMLADSLLPIPFWAEAVNTACYVQNRVLVTKAQNKTPYELLHGRTPSIGFIRPFGCLVTILNTLDSLGKFDGKVDEGFLVGYFVSSKAFRVFNSRTRIVQETFDPVPFHPFLNLYQAERAEKESVSITGAARSYLGSFPQRGLNA
nr:retrovirus-related Pol polyprotein from transposon TNT 1-94 [Tanacetum cinerariifolium]